MKRVLFIAYHFPPLAGGGTFRSLKFVKYLPEFGWLPTVITTNSKNYWAYDNSLLDEIPKDVKVIRAPEIDPFYLQIVLSKFGLLSVYKFIRDKFLIPDEKIGWIPFAYKKARKELKKNKYDLIFSTSPTICSHLIAMKLSKKYNIPWVCDFRDYWILHHTYPFRNSIRGNKEKKIENNIFLQSNAITTVSNGVREDFVKEHVNIPPSKISVITNGYDTEKVIKSSVQDKYSKFIISYTGSFYGIYNPNNFISALNNLLDNKPEMKSTLSLQFIGNISNQIQDYLYKECRVPFQILSFQSQHNLKIILEKSQLLLLILPGKDHYKSYIPAKLFSYLAYKKPVLAIIPDGETKKILDKSNYGYFANPNSIEEIKNQILNLYNLWKENKLNPRPNTEYIKQFHRRNLTKQLVDIFEEVT